MAHGIAIDTETVRPYRLWNANKGEFLRWRYYSDRRRCHIGALIEARWSRIGTVIEVIDVSTTRLVGQYKRGVHDIKFLRG